ncbi:MAG TPA: hypothetical protein VF910_01100 [Candidatus Bathyarchaeia archaeon]
MSPPTAGIRDADVQALIARAEPRDRVILATLPDDPERIHHVERHDVMVIPKEDWIQILIWLAELSREIAPRIPGNKVEVSRRVPRGPGGEPPK